jgi:hypothetical protein
LFDTGIVSVARFAFSGVTPVRIVTSNRPSHPRPFAYAEIAARNDLDAILHLGDIDNQLKLLQ